MSWCRWVFSSNAVSACAPRWSVNAPGATPHSTPQVGTSFTPVRQGPRPAPGAPGPAGRGPPSAVERGAGRPGAAGRLPGAADADGDTPGTGACGIAGTPGSGA